jgi:ABC-type bacteriocin/lantibiotic exporter with double-glycine peptidase domain
MKIDLPILKQETPFTCLPACVRIVLSYYEHELCEEDIAAACQVNRRGTRFDHVVKFVRSIGFEITRIKDGGINDLFEHLTVNQPIIAALGAEHLPYASTRSTHAVVICGLKENEVIFIDPAPGKEIHLDSLTFYKAWTSRGCSGLVIEPRI